MKESLMGKCFKAAVKLDICKAYGRIEWNFLECIMKKLAFDEKWDILILNV